MQGTGFDSSRGPFQSYILFLLLLTESFLLSARVSSKKPCMFPGVLPRNHTDFVVKKTDNF